MTDGPVASSSADPRADGVLPGPRPGSARPVVGGLLLLLVAGLVATVDDPVAPVVAVVLAVGGVFLVLAGLYFLLSNVDDVIRTRLLRRDAPSRDA